MCCRSKFKQQNTKLEKCLPVYSFVAIATVLMILSYTRHGNHIKGFLDISKINWKNENVRTFPTFRTMEPCLPLVNFTRSNMVTDCFYECMDRNLNLTSENNLRWTSIINEDKINVSQLHNVPNTLPFLSTSRNPCFLTKSLNQTKLRCLPYFFLAGFPKTGTTDLYQRIRLHRYIQSPLKKEPHWWSNTRRKPFGSYLDQFVPNHDFPNISSQNGRIQKSATTIFGDFSTREFLDENLTTHWDPQNSTLSVIKKILPCAKFVVMLRDPVDRLYSDYLYFSGRQLNSTKLKDRQHITPQDFHNKCMVSIHWWKSCLQKHRGDIKYCLHTANNMTGIPPLNTSHNKCWSQNITACKAFKNGLYYYYIHDWLQVFPKSHFIFIRLEDYARDKVRVMNRVLRFLGSRYFNEEELKKVRNMYKQVPGGAVLRSSYPPMYQATRSMLKDFYRESNIKLAKLLGDDNYNW